jgi:alpha-tubulin suppressor-like RCC1 family protein
MKISKMFNRFLIFAAIFISSNYCDIPNEPNGNFPKDFIGQLETDLDNAILKPDGTVWTWGGNSTGQLGDGTMIPSEIPKKIATLKNIVAIDLVEGAAYAADIEGNIWFWGDRLIWGQHPDSIVTVPKKISFLKDVKFIQVISTSVYLLRFDGTVWVMIWNHLTPTKYLVPKQIQELNNIAAISGFLALKNDGTLCELRDFGWRNANHGCLNDSEDFPLTNIIEIDHEYVNSIALLNDGTVWTWGVYLSPGGGSLSLSNPVPTKVPNLENIIHISHNGKHALALKSDGTIWYWWGPKRNPEDDNTPIKIENIDNVRLIHASAVNKSLVMKNDGTYWSIDNKTKEIKRIEIP